MSMEDWEKQKIVELLKDHCIKRLGGHVLLHSGQKSSWTCDLLLVQRHFRGLMASLRPNFPTVGIELGGMLLAQVHGGAFVRKDGTFYSNGYSPRKVSLVDDVVTTGHSMAEASLALDSVGIEVGEYLCVLDRRDPEHRIMEIQSLVTAEDLELPYD